VARPLLSWKQVQKNVDPAQASRLRLDQVRNSSRTLTSCVSHLICSRAARQNRNLVLAHPLFDESFLLRLKPLVNTTFKNLATDLLLSLMDTYNLLLNVMSKFIANRKVNFYVCLRMLISAIASVVVIYATDVGSKEILMARSLMPPVGGDSGISSEPESTVFSARSFARALMFSTPLLGASLAPESFVFSMRSFVLYMGFCSSNPSGASSEPEYTVSSARSFACALTKIFFFFFLSSSPLRRKRKKAKQQAIGMSAKRPRRGRSVPESPPLPVLPLLPSLPGRVTTICDGWAFAFVSSTRMSSGSAPVKRLEPFVTLKIGPIKESAGVIAVVMASRRSSALAPPDAEFCTKLARSGETALDEEPPEKAFEYAGLAMIDATAAAAAAMLAEDAFDIVSEIYCASDCARIAGTETPSCTTRVSPSSVMFRESSKTLGSGEAEAEEPCMRRRPRSRRRLSPGLLVRLLFKSSPIRLKSELAMFIGSVLFTATNRPSQAMTPLTKVWLVL
jgi:hypothetical protein